MNNIVVATPSSGNIELYLLKLFFSFDLFQKHRDSFDVGFLKQHNKELFLIYRSIELFHETFPAKSISSTEELEVWHESQFPTTSKSLKETLSYLYTKLSKIEPDPDVAGRYLEEYRRRTLASKTAFLALEVAEGKKSFEELITEAQAISEDVTEGDYSEFVDDDAKAIVERIKAPGLNWRLTTMNQMLGPLRKGDFGFLFARPEAGKTTFLADQATFMAEQADGPIIWFNNEQSGEVVLARCQQAALGITSQELFDNYEVNREKYRALTHGRLFIYDSANIHRRDVQRLCRKYSPKLIIFDQIDKIKGFDNDRYDLELKVLYQWARELAKEYGPVIGVCQAGVTGEGKKYLTMDDVDSSKTAKQGEADWILGIGKTNQEGMESLRHLHFCKNKLFGGSESVATLRHGKRDVLIFPNIARYKDIT